MSNIQAFNNGESAIVVDKIYEVQKLHPVPDDAKGDLKYSKEAYQLAKIVTELPKELVFNDRPFDTNLVRIIRNVEMGVSQEIANKAKSIQSFIRTCRGDLPARTILFTHIKYFLEMINIQRRPSPAQVTGMIDDILSEFTDLSISDIILCLRDIRTGKYDKLYESFSVEKLGHALREHRESKALSLQQAHERVRKQPESALKIIFEHGPPEQVEKLKQSFTEVIDAFESQRKVPSVENLQFFQDKPKQKWKAAAPLTESDFERKIKNELTPRLHGYSATQFEQACDYYFTNSQQNLFEWLLSEFEQRYPEEHQKYIQLFKDLE